MTDMTQTEAAPAAVRKKSTRKAGTLLVATAKGAFLLEARGRSWRLSKPMLLGSKIHDMQLDPRDGRTLLVTATGGHLGPTVYRSLDRGLTLTEALKPPAFKKAAKHGKSETTRGLSVQSNFWLSPGHADEPDVWYLGTVPQGLFRSEDGGRNWKGVKGFNEHPDYKLWVGPISPPDGGFLHSIRIDPRDPNHLYISLSMGGTFESRDRGKKWTPLNRGIESDFNPGPALDYGQDPHNMLVHAGDPDVLYQQNHCGIYRMDRLKEDVWRRIGKKMPRKIGDIGFALVGHPTDPDTVWVLPMDGTKVWPRTSPEGRPAVYVTRNGGRSWQRLDRGLPSANAFMTVKRQAMCRDDQKDPTLFFGTTSGEIWMGRKGGEEFACIARHLPQIYSISATNFA